MSSVPVHSATWPTASEWFFLAPVLLLACWGLLVLLLDVLAFRRRVSPTQRAKLLNSISLAGAFAALGLSVLLLSPGWLSTDVLAANEAIFNGTISLDAASALLQVVVIGFLVLVISFSNTWRFTESLSEYYALLFWSAVGMVLLIEAEEFMTLFVALETMTISMYLLTALETRARRSAEAALKYFIYGSVASALFLFGLSWIYGLTGTTNLEAVGRSLAEPGLAAGIGGQWTAGSALLLVLAGFGFKVALVPFHQWAPDVYEGAPAPVAGWIAAGSKFASFIALIKVLILALGSWSSPPGQPESPGWIAILAVLAVVSMTYGNLAALGQQNFKRLLAYSSIAHTGYLLVGVVAIGVSTQRAGATAAVLYYLCLYGLATLGTFAVAAWLARDLGSDQIEDLNGLGYRSPLLAFCLSILLLSLIGIPPLAGFFGKMAMFMEALNTGPSGKISLTWLVAIALVNNVISAFYYVRILKAMYLRAAAGSGRASGASLPSGVAWTLMLAAVANLGLGLYPSAFFAPLEGVAISLVTPHGPDGTDRGPRFAAPGSPPRDRHEPEQARIVAASPAASPHH